MLKIQCTKFNFGWGSTSDSTGGVFSTPPDPIRGLILRGGRMGSPTHYFRLKSWEVRENGVSHPLLSDVALVMTEWRHAKVNQSIHVICQNTEECVITSTQISLERCSRHRVVSDLRLLFKDLRHNNTGKLHITEMYNHIILCGRD